VRFEARRTAGTVEPEQRWQEVADYRDFMIRNLDDAKQVDGYQQSGVKVYKSEARIAGPGRVEVDGDLLESERIVLTTGSDAQVPPIPGLEEAGYWTNREATTVKQIPHSVGVLGGGPVGIVLGQSPVADVASELPEDGRRGVAREPRAPRGVEAVDRLDQPQHRDLRQVIQGLAGVHETPSEFPRERQEALDERVAHFEVAVLVVVDQQRALTLARVGAVVARGTTPDRQAGCGSERCRGHRDGGSVIPRPEH
jgi:hypothetical protein